MIRRLLAFALALGLFAQVADARTLIVIPRPSAAEVTADSDNGYTNARSMNRNLFMFSRLITQTGGSVGYAYDSDVKTEWARNGYVVRGGVFGSSGANAPGYLDQYDAVVFFGPVSASPAGRCRPDSMSYYTKYPKVPFAWIGQSSAIAGTGAFNANSGAAPVPTDTCGIVSGSGLFYAYNGAVLTGSNFAWTTMAYTQALAVATAPNSRTLIVPVVLSRANEYFDAEATGTPCSWCNRARSEGTKDSAYVVKKIWSDISNAKPYVIGMFNQFSTAESSTVMVPTEGEMSLAMATLAVLDSASGGRVFGSKPVIMAPVMDKGLHRGQRRGPNGIFAADTTGHYAIVDSIRANGIPLTVAFDTNADTVAAYSRDLIKYAQAASIKFTPQVWLGVMDTTKTAAKGNTSLMLQRDVFGRWRNRAAVGDSLRHTVTGSDTTLAAGLYAMRARGDSILAAFGVANRSVRVLLAPDDDWSPLLLRRGPYMSPTPDSVLYAMKAAGFDGIIVDAQDAEADANRGGAFANTNPRGWYAKEMDYRSRLLSDFRLLAHAGYPWMGGRAQYSTYSDSTAPFDSLNVGIQYMELARAWYGAFLTQDRSYDLWPYDSPAGNNVWPYWANNHFRLADFVYGLRGPAHIIRFSASDFSGAPAAPAANGFHVLKSIQQACLAINRLAGRTVVRLGYPDEVQP